ncbi:MAG: hypothetical protein GX825_09580 [Syntrophomonadaceae bacterium]|nr:hypothetical protein [Syntrophomonadaceae bacterium]
MHPSIYPLIEGGVTIEYGAHMVPEAGFRGIPKKIFREGLLLVGDAAGFVINTGYSIRGIDLAIVSGIAAARAVIGAENLSAVGPLYLDELNKIKLLPTMKAQDGFFDVLETPWIYDKMPNLAVDVFDNLFTVSGKVPGGIKKDVKRLIKSNDLSMWQFIKLGFKGMRAL